MAAAAAKLLQPLASALLETAGSDDDSAVYRLLPLSGRLQCLAGRDDVEAGAELLLLDEAELPRGLVRGPAAVLDRLSKDELRTLVAALALADENELLQLAASAASAALDGSEQWLKRLVDRGADDAATFAALFDGKGVNGASPAADLHSVRVVVSPAAFEHAAMDDARAWRRQEPRQLLAIDADDAAPVHPFELAEGPNWQISLAPLAGYEAGLIEHPLAVDCTLEDARRLIDDLAVSLGGGLDDPSTQADVVATLCRRMRPWSRVGVILLLSEVSGGIVAARAVCGDAHFIPLEPPVELDHMPVAASLLLRRTVSGWEPAGQGAEIAGAVGDLVRDHLPWWVGHGTGLLLLPIPRTGRDEVHLRAWSAHEESLQLLALGLGRVRVIEEAKQRAKSLQGLLTNLQRSGAALRSAGSNASERVIVRHLLHESREFPVHLQTLKKQLGLRGQRTGERADHQHLEHAVAALDDLLEDLKRIEQLREELEKEQKAVTLDELQHAVRPASEAARRRAAKKLSTEAEPDPWLPPIRSQLVESMVRHHPPRVLTSLLLENAVANGLAGAAACGKGKTSEVIVRVEDQSLTLVNPARTEDWKSARRQLNSRQPDSLGVAFMLAAARRLGASLQADIEAEEGDQCRARLSILPGGGP